MEPADHTQGHLDCNIKEVTGDLFRCPETHSLAHCISADVKMGKGIAVAFKEKFGGVNDLLRQGQRPGGLAVLNRGGRFIYYLITKEKYWMKPTYNTLHSSLVKMRDHIRTNRVSNLSMPKIGCGLDQLEWDKVFNMIQEIYADLNIQITIYHYEGDKKGAGRGKRNPGYGGHEHYRSRDQRDQQSHRSNSGHRYNESGTRSSRPSHRDGFSGENKEYGPALPNQSKKESRRQTQIQDYARSQPASRKVEETLEEEWPSLPGTNKPKDKDERPDDGSTRQVDGQSKMHNEERNDDKLGKVNKRNQETSKNDEKDQKTRENNKEGRKESIDGKQNKNNKEQTSNKKDDVLQDKSEEEIEEREKMNTKESFNEYKEDTMKTSVAQDEDQSGWKNSDDVTLAPAN